ncbi:MAG: hypothetical protein Q8910_00190 [Bacteroidota bacterium]|nr:hypothetical protein [Bacteroidota bacterium]
MINKEDFLEMIRDWKADHSPEMDDLEIDEVKNEYGEWLAYAHDEKCMYQLSDEGNGNITINYLGTK